MLKRIFDVSLALVAILALTPVFLGIALAIKICDFGPILFKQRRVGLRGKVFDMFKFRSMIVDAEQMGGYVTILGDDRITVVGKFIRRTSIDELPQLFNVLRGDMSLVGPRPDVPSQRDLYTDEEWEIRHRLRPGITGLAQATYRYEATPAQRKAMDLQYVQSHSFSRDLHIILLTVKQVFGKGGN